MSEDAVIRRISENFVPAAVNLYFIRDAKDAGGELFRAVRKQKYQYQGIWIVSPDGTLLASHSKFESHKTWTRELLDTFDAALKAFGPVEPRAVKPVDPLPYRGAGVRPDGSVTLASYSCFTKYKIEERTQAIDSITLDAKEWATLAPPQTSAGTQWRVPEAVARKFCRVISPSLDTEHMPNPEDCKVAELTGLVESVDGGKITLRFAGKWESAHAGPNDPRKRLSYCTSEADGVATYDAERKSLTSVLFVFKGKYRPAAPYDETLWDVGGLAEWSLERPEPKVEKP